MAIDRRQFAAGALALLAAPAGAGERRSIESTIIAAATRNQDGTFAAVLYDLDKGLLNAARLPARGHDIAVNPVTRACVAFARRPGTFAVSFGLTRDHPPVIFHAPANRHFYGHGVFSADGRLLYTTENDFDGARGIIGVWNAAADYRRIGEFPSHGIGPHDINLLRDGRTLVVANGGLLTHPEHGRQPLNLATMTPTLAYIDTKSGDLLERHQMQAGMEKRSIRHLDVGADDTVVFGCQFKGPRSRVVDLVGFHQRGKTIELLAGDADLHRALRHYVSSVSVDRRGEFCAVTSSRGQQVAIIDIVRQRVIGLQRFADVSGVTAGSNEGGSFIVSSGGGGVARMNGNRITPAGETAPWSWDNHAISVPI